MSVRVKRHVHITHSWGLCLDLNPLARKFMMKTHMSDLRPSCFWGRITCTEWDSSVLGMGWLMMQIALATLPTFLTCYNDRKLLSVFWCVHTPNPLLINKAWIEFDTSVWTLIDSKFNMHGFGSNSWYEKKRARSSLNKTVRFSAITMMNVKIQS